jgi:hypothetical protein
VAERGIESGHRFKFHETEVVARISGYMDRLVKEPITIKLHPDSINREKGLKISQAWNPSSNLLRHPHHIHTHHGNPKETQQIMQKK